MNRIVDCKFTKYDEIFLNVVRDSLEEEDVFLTKSGDVFSAKRSDMIIWHGNGSQNKSLLNRGIGKVYLGHEKVVGSAEDYVKILEGIYHGRKSRAIKNCKKF